MECVAASSTIGPRAQKNSGSAPKGSPSGAEGTSVAYLSIFWLCVRSQQPAGPLRDLPLLQGTDQVRYSQLDDMGGRNSALPRFRSRMRITLPLNVFR